MGDNKGILTSVQEQKLSVIVDNALELKGLLELVDGYLSKVLITLLDDQLIDKVASKLQLEIKEQVVALVDAAIAEDIELAESLAADLINSLVDVPVLDEESEGLIFKGAVELLVGTILNWIAKKKEGLV